jgi:hypothetical protein
MAESYLQAATVDETLTMVARSWVQDMGVYQYPKAPQVLTHDRRTNRRNTTWQLPKIDNALDKTGLWHAYEPGEALGQIGTVKKGTVTATPVGYAGLILSKTDDELAGVNGDQLFEDLAMGGDGVPLLMAQASQAIDGGLVGALYNATNYGAVVSFTGTGTKGLDDPSDYANQQPVRDINSALQGLRWRQSLGLRLVCHVHPLVLDILSEHPDYTGVGLLTSRTAGLSGKMTRQAIVERFMDIHKIDEVRIYEGVADTVAPGQTSAPNYLATDSTVGPLLSFTLDDHTRPNFDVSAGGAITGADGGLAIAWGRMPTVVTWREEKYESTYWQIRSSYHIIAPRYQSDTDANFGAIFRGVTSGGNMGVFTTAP